MSENLTGKKGKNSRPVLEKGTKISNYSIQEKFASGEQCDIYHARDLKLNRNVSLCIAWISDPDAEDEINRFEREAQSIASFNHPNIVRIYGFSNYNGYYYGVLEPFKGRLLHDIIKKGPIPQSKCMDIAIQLCKGLEEAHKARVIHRNLCPANILIDEKGRVKLLGFGLIRLNNDSNISSKAYESAKVSYYSPEQIKGKPADMRCNIFSLGVILYEMLTGRHPFRKDCASCTGENILNNTPEPLDEYKADIPKMLQQIVDRMMNKRSDSRYQDLGDLQIDLERESLKQETDESERQYRNIVERAGDGICIIQDRMLKFINRRLAKMVGYTVNESLNTSFIDYLDPGEINRVAGKYLLLMTGKDTSQQYETTLIHKDSSKVEVEINARRIVYQDRPAVLSFARDIAERKRFEREIRDSEANYRSLYENMFDGAYRTQSDGRILSANPALVMMLGYNSEEELCKSFTAQDLYVNPDDRSILIKKMEKDGELRNVEFTLKRKDGREIKVMESARVAHDAYGNTFYEGVLTDITERKLADEKLQRMSSIVRQSAEGIAQSDLDGNLEFVNEAFARMHGYSPEELLGKSLAIFHTPEQMEVVREGTIQLKEKGEFSGEIWHKRRDGSVFPAYMQNSLLYDDASHLVGMIGTMLDISEQKQAENALRESEERYRLLINNYGHPVTLCDLDGKVLLMNNTGAKYLDGVPGDFIGKSLLEIFPDKGKEFMERNNEVINSGIGIEYDDMLSLPTGKYWVRTNVQPAKKANGEIMGVQVIAHDITQRKMAEEALREAHDRLTATLNALPDLLFEVDRDGRIMDFRTHRPDHLYIKPEEFLNKKVSDCLPSNASEIIMQSIMEAAENGLSRGAVYSLDINGNTNWFELSIAVRGDPHKADCHFIALARDITDRKHGEDMLKKATEKLEEERGALQEKNIALRQILEQIGMQREDYRQKLLLDMEQSLAPFLKKLKEKEGYINEKELEALESNLNAILAKDLDDFNGRYARLTARESEISEMIKKGMSSKEISNSLNLSLLTVAKHREQIRRKLGISNTSANLATYLRVHRRD